MKIKAVQRITKSNYIKPTSFIIVKTSVKNTCRSDLPLSITSIPLDALEEAGEVRGGSEHHNCQADLSLSHQYNFRSVGISSAKQS
jgi:hypothetical protein